MPTSGSTSPATGAGLEPIGDPDDVDADFANEHEQFVVDEDDDADEKESESPDRYAGGLDREGPP